MDILYREFRLKQYFPGLSNSDFKITSPHTVQYNCIAWAVGDSEKWWDPTREDHYWPAGFDRLHSLEGFIEVFQSLGYIITDNVDYEEDYEKAAIYVKSNGETRAYGKTTEFGQMD